MSNKTFWLAFGSGNGASFSVSVPTLILFQTGTGTTLTPPGITQRIAGTGAYQFDYDSSTFSIFFRADGGASLPASTRYIEGVLDPVTYVDQSINALGSTVGALGSSLTALGSSVGAIGSSLSAISTFLGSTASVIGTTAIDPSTVFGWLKRQQEFNEGTASYIKSTGIWTVTSRGGTNLMSKTLTNTTAQSTKT